MIAEKNQYIGSAYKRLQIISQDKEKQLEYEAREKAVRDYNQMMKEAEQRGREQGEKIGREQGEKIGREASERAIKKAVVERAKSMKKDGLPLEKIVQYSGLSLQEVEELS